MFIFRNRKTSDLNFKLKDPLMTVKIGSIPYTETMLHDLPIAKLRAIEGFQVCPVLHFIHFSSLSARLCIRRLEK